jgi:demethylmenaquinone methyltransferase / 2-methoxy-6-polyprenyl-1,4-benzoquinol methylase
VRKMFDQIAPTYELVNSLASAGRDGYWRRQMVRLAEVRADDTLLDIACGTGDVARTFAAASTRPAHIVGMDFSLPMLLQATDRPIERAEFCQGDALHLPFVDESVSIISCAFGIRNFQNLFDGLSEMHRVLRAGGRTVILEFSVPSRPLFRQLYLFYIRHFMPWIATLISRDRSGAYRYLPRSVVSFQGRDAIISSLKAAGFARVTVHPFSFGIVAIYVAWKAGPNDQ